MSNRDSVPEDPTFLSRWMRRKSQPEPVDERESSVSDPAEISAEQSRATLQQIDAPSQTESDLPEPAGRNDDSELANDDTNNTKPQLVDGDMPSIESLNEASDFGQFMSPGVSDVLRKAALRKLFRLPVFGIRDGLDDYDEDFRSFAALGNIITADMRFEKQRFEERMREAIEKRRLAGEEIDEETEEQLVSEAGRAVMPDEPSAPEDNAGDSNQHTDSDEEDEDGETDEEALG